MKAKKFKGINHGFRPKSYWEVTDPLAAFLPNVKGKINVEFAAPREQVARAVNKLRIESTSARDFSTRFEQLDTAGLALDVRVNPKGKVEILSATPASS